MTKRPKTPCVGICSTGIGDSVCRGCKRFSDEVIQWNSYDDTARQAVLDRLEMLLVNSLQAKFHIFDEQLLAEQIRFQQIPFDAAKSPYCWLYELLRNGAGQIHALSDYGVSFTAEFPPADLTELKRQIDAEYYTLSCAYYERYVQPRSEVPA